VYWDYDHALRLYPAPHCVILGDRTEQQALAKFEGSYFVFCIFPKSRHNVYCHVWSAVTQVLPLHARI